MLYDLLFTLLYPFLALPLFFTWLLDPANRREWSERAGFLEIKNKKTKEREQTAPHLWIHVSSAGELITALPFIKKYLALHPVPILLTVFNRDTLRVAAKHTIFSAVHFLPVENPWAYRKLIQTYRVDKIFFFETEIWPLLLSILHRKKIAAFLINAQIYDREFSQYRRFRFLFRPLLKAFQKVFVQTMSEKNKFLALGVPEERIVVAGSLKYDLELPSSPLSEGLFEKYGIPSGEDAFVFAAGSTHAGEDLILVNAAVDSLKPELNGKVRHSVCVIAPRDPGRSDFLCGYLKQKELPFIRRSTQLADQKKSPGLSDDPEWTTRPTLYFYILDTIGELREIYALAALVFVGGSLIPYGGHNLLEPLGLGKRTVTGPHAFHFQSVLENLGEWIDRVTPEELPGYLSRRFHEGKPKNNPVPRLKIENELRGASDRILKILI